MGLFDSVYVPCPYCAVENEMQSKAGECVREEYVLEHAPAELVADIVSDGPFVKCGVPLTRLPFKQYVEHLTKTPKTGTYKDIPPSPKGCGKVFMVSGRTTVTKEQVLKLMG